MRTLLGPFAAISLLLCAGLSLAVSGKAPRIQEPRGVSILEAVIRADRFASGTA